MTTPAFLTEANKLRNVEMNLAKRETVILDHLSRYDESSHFADLKREFESLRHRELENHKNELKSSIQRPLQHVKSLIPQGGDAVVSGGLDLGNLKKDMAAVQDNIQSLKRRSKASIEKLQQDEKVLTKDVQQLEINNNNNNNSSTKTTTNKVSYDSSNLCPEVKAFLKFVYESGGHENGWTVEDHKLFLKVRSKNAHEVQLAKSLHKMLPDVSENRIVKHELWYRKYLESRALQKEAIRTWRISKGTRDVPKREQPVHAVTTIPKSNNMSRGHIQEQLSAWKEEKKRKQKQERQEKLQAAVKARERREKQKQDYEEKKKLVENWKSTRQANEEAEKSEKQRVATLEREMKALQAHKLIKEYQEQDTSYVRKMRSIRQRASSVDPAPFSRTTAAERDPQRLLKPTKQWVLRTMPSENSLRTDVNFIKSIQKLAIPQWRKGMPPQ